MSIKFLILLAYLNTGVTSCLPSRTISPTPPAIEISTLWVFFHDRFPSPLLWWPSCLEEWCSHPPPLPSGSLLMALALGSLCLGASRLLSPPLPRIVVRGPRLTLCTVGQPLYLVNGSVAVSGYRWSSGPGGSAPWYRTISWEHCSVRSASSKNCDLASVAFSRTSRYWVYPSFLLLLVSSCGSVTANTLLCGIAPPRPPLGPCSLLIGWFSLLWLRAQWSGLVVGVSDLPPLPLTGHALLLVRFRWVYGLSFRLPHTY